MKNILIFSDLHLNQESLHECESILDEIIILAEKNSADTVIDLGDTFNNLKPTSSELDVFAEFVKKLNRKLIIIAADSHESISKEESVVNHYGILSDNVSVVKEYHDNGNLFCGHFIVKGAKKDFGAIITQKELSEKYRFSFLGHQHSFQQMDNVYQLGCYDNKTEILTNKGWKFFKDLDKEEKIATLNSYIKKIQYQKPTNYFSSFYAGEMYSLKRNYANLLVTPNHNLYCCCKGKKKEWGLFQANQIFQKNEKYLLRTYNPIQQSSPKMFSLLKYKHTYFSGRKHSIKKNINLKQIDIPFELFVQFMAWFLSEGYVSKTENFCNITQHKNSKNISEIKIVCEAIANLLGKKLNIKNDRNCLRFQIYDGRLAKYLRQFGTARNKYIPQIIKTAAPSDMDLFIKTYIKGDGHISRTVKMIRSFSNRMLNDLQEMSCKLGWPSRIFSTAIYFYKRKSSTIYPRHEKIESYAGQVYCVEVPNHIILIRRNGIPTWCGNSSRYVSFDEWHDKKVVALITNYKEKTEKLEFIELKSPISMQVLYLEQKTEQNEAKMASNRLVEPQSKGKRGRPRKCSLPQPSCVQPSQETQKTTNFEDVCQILDNLDPQTKVKLIIKDFNSYRQFLTIEHKYRTKFVKFVRENDFLLIADNVSSKENKQTNLKESFDVFAKEKEVNQVIVEIIKKELK
jgi:hypothetical protein